MFKEYTGRKNSFPSSHANKHPRECFKYFTENLSERFEQVRKWAVSWSSSFRGGFLQILKIDQTKIVKITKATTHVLRSVKLNWITLYLHTYNYSIT